MRVYQFMKLDDARDALSEQRLKISKLDNLNDLFEFLGAHVGDKKHRRELREAKAKLAAEKGLLCFSKGWHNPVLWGHYADGHQGLCFGFDIPMKDIRHVSYVTSRLAWPAVVDESFVEQLMYTKFVHWSYEDEYRSWVPLDTAKEGYKPFSKSLELKQVLVGARSDVTRSEVDAALGDRAKQVECFKVRAAFRSFRVVKQRNLALWR